jgi:hypothetical protein
MKSRLLSSIWLSLLLLFAQQVAFAGSVIHAYDSGSDTHQYAFEESSSSDDDASRHFTLDNFSGLPSSFSLPVLSSWNAVQVPTGISRLVTVVSPYYSSRAPPLL